MADTLHKNRRPIDLLPDHPYQAIKGAWDSVDLDYLLAELQAWFYMAISCEEGAYDQKDQREPFIQFYDRLLYLVEALYFLNKRRDYEKINKLAQQSKEAQDWAATLNLPRLLDKQEVKNPIPIIQHFCNDFPLEYTRIELWDFLEAVELYDGPFREQSSGASICEFYIILATLIEATYLIARE